MSHPMAETVTLERYATLCSVPRAYEWRWTYRSDRGAISKGGHHTKATCAEDFTAETGIQLNLPTRTRGKGLVFTVKGKTAERTKQ